MRILSFSHSLDALLFESNLFYWKHFLTKAIVFERLYRLKMNFQPNKTFLTKTTFLDASTQIYRRVCPSVRPLVGRSVCPSVRLTFLLNRGNQQIWQVKQTCRSDKSDKSEKISLQFYLSPLLQTHLCLNKLVFIFVSLAAIQRIYNLLCLHPSLRITFHLTFFPWW